MKKAPDFRFNPDYIFDIYTLEYVRGFLPKGEKSKVDLFLHEYLNYFLSECEKIVCRELRHGASFLSYRIMDKYIQKCRVPSVGRFIEEDDLDMFVPYGRNDRRFFRWIVKDSDLAGILFDNFDFLFVNFAESGVDWDIAASNFEEKRYNLAYGGREWAQFARMCEKASKCKSDEVWFYIDRLVNMSHHSGSFWTKFYDCMNLKTNMDIQHSAKSIKDIVQRSTYKARKIFNTLRIQYPELKAVTA